MLIRERRFAEARSRLEAYLASAPATVQVLWLLGGACQELGDSQAAQFAFSRLLALDARWVPARTARAELLAREGHIATAEMELRRALADDPRFTRAGVSLAQILREQGRPTDALAVTTAARSAQPHDPDLAIEHALALQSAGRLDEAVAVLDRAVQQAPQRGDLHHYLALARHARGDHRHAADHARRALAMGWDRAETWGVLARALAASGQLVEAEDAFREGLRRDPDHAPMHEDFARLLWLRHGDLERASVALDEALERNPANASFWAVKAQLCATVGDSAQAYALFARAAALAPDVVSYELAASAAALGTQPRKALDHARSAAAREPSSSRGGLVQALLVAGDYDEASRLLEQAQREQPDDQQVLALQSVLWRLQGDARYGSLYDYARCVRAWTLDTPPGWSSLDAYLADLRETLRRMHAFRGHPPDQSLRGGSQTMGDLATHSDPVIRAFFDHAIAGPIVRHIEWLGHGDDPMRRRHGGRGRVHAAWSVLLQPEGFHVDHVHPDGWLSSACYIDLPGTLGSGASEGEGSREGWLRFGAVPLPLASPMGAEHYVRPEPGRLVLFPSYMWHGTVPFRGPHTRLTIAFDVLPA